jgi:hypothetical protein
MNTRLVGIYLLAGMALMLLPVVAVVILRG